MQFVKTIIGIVPTFSEHPEFNLIAAIAKQVKKQLLNFSLI